MIRESRKICESLMIHESKIHSFLFNKRFANQRWFANQSWIESFQKKIRINFLSRSLQKNSNEIRITNHWFGFVTSPNTRWEFCPRSLPFALGQVPSTLASLGKGNCPLEIRFPESGNFFQGKKRQPFGTIFSIMEIQIPMDLWKFLPSPDSSVGRVPGYRGNGHRFKSCVLLIVITNDFIIFEFSLLNLNFKRLTWNSA